MTVATIVFFCIPAWGHTNPTLGVVRELVQRGHRVVYDSYGSLRDAAELRACSGAKGAADKIEAVLEEAKWN